jgi:hypothetical protein
MVNSGSGITQIFLVRKELKGFSIYHLTFLIGHLKELETGDQVNASDSEIWALLLQQ